MSISTLQTQTRRGRPTEPRLPSRATEPCMRSSPTGAVRGVRPPAARRHSRRRATCSPSPVVTASAARSSSSPATAPTSASSLQGRSPRHPGQRTGRTSTCRAGRRTRAQRRGSCAPTAPGSDGWRLHGWSGTIHAGRSARQARSSRRSRQTVLATPSRAGTTKPSGSTQPRRRSSCGASTAASDGS